MTVYETIIATYPELENADLFELGIILQDDSDGLGIFVAEWGYLKPLPNGMKVGK
jgi:hypothetical protein